MTDLFALYNILVYREATGETASVAAARFWFYLSPYLHIKQASRVARVRRHEGARFLGIRLSVQHFAYEPEHGLVNYDGNLEIHAAFVCRSLRERGGSVHIDLLPAKLESGA